MRSPQIQRGGFLGLIAGSIVDACNTALVAGHVVQNGLDHVRLYSDLRHAGCYGSPQIMNDPGRHWLGFLVGLLDRPNDSLIESILGLAPAAKAALAFTKYKITALAPLLMLKNGAYRRGRPYDVLATVLGPMRRQVDYAAAKVDLRPAQVCDLSRA